MDLDFSIITSNLHFLIDAMLVTIKFTIISFIFALLIALVVGILRSSKIPCVIDKLLKLYMEIFRGSPLLIQLFFIYYGLPTIGIVLSCDTAAIVGLALNSGAYMSEIVRAAMISIPKGQDEAAYVLGYNPLQAIIHIKLPQAIKIATPSLVNGFSGLLKDTSLISVISITELTRSGNLIYSRTSRPFEVYLTLGIAYFIMTYIISFLSRFLERSANSWSQ